jgi:hypothetical protein
MLMLDVVPSVNEYARLERTPPAPPPPPALPPPPPPPATAMYLVVSDPDPEVAKVITLPVAKKL